MVSQCVENNRTDPLIFSSRWLHEGADLSWYVWGHVRSGTAHQKHSATWFVRVFRVLTVTRAEKHSHLACCSWLSSKNDAFAHILDGTYELWWAPIKNTRSHCQDRCFSFLALYVELHFHTRWSTWRSSSCSKHESFCTSLRKHVVPAHSDRTPGCPGPFTSPHSISSCSSLLSCAKEGIIFKHWFVVFTVFLLHKDIRNG